MNINLDEITVKIKFIEAKQLKAIITLDFGDFVIKGFRIMDSEHPNSRGEKLWLTPPSYRDGGGRYHPIFFVPDKALWKQLEEKVWVEYDRQKNEHYRKRFDLPVEDLS